MHLAASQLQRGDPPDQRAHHKNPTRSPSTRAWQSRQPSVLPLPMPAPTTMGWGFPACAGTPPRARFRPRHYVPRCPLSPHLRPPRRREQGHPRRVGKVTFQAVWWSIISLGVPRARLSHRRQKRRLPTRTRALKKSSSMRSLLSSVRAHRGFPPATAAVPAQEEERDAMSITPPSLTRRSMRASSTIMA